MFSVFALRPSVMTASCSRAVIVSRYGPQSARPKAAVAAVRGVVAHRPSNSVMERRRMGSQWYQRQSVR